MRPPVVCEPRQCAVCSGIAEGLMDHLHARPKELHTHCVTFGCTAQPFYVHKR